MEIHRPPYNSREGVLIRHLFWGRVCRSWWKPGTALLREPSVTAFTSWGLWDITDSVPATWKFQTRSGQKKILSVPPVLCSFSDLFLGVFPFSLCLSFILRIFLFFSILKNRLAQLEITALIPTRGKQSCIIKKIITLLSTLLSCWHLLSKFGFEEPASPRVRSLPDWKVGTWGKKHSHFPASRGPIRIMLQQPIFYTRLSPILPVAGGE